MMTTTTPYSPPRLSPEAHRLLDVLRQHGADAPERAMTDSELAGLIGCRPRDVILHAAELLKAGHLVLAVCRGRHRGRFVGTIAQAEKYAEALKRRAAAIRRRADAVEGAISAARQAAAQRDHEQRRQPPPSLFDGIPLTPARPREQQLAAFTR